MRIPRGKRKTNRGGREEGGGHSEHLLDRIGQALRDALGRPELCAARVPLHATRVHGGEFADTLRMSEQPSYPHNSAVACTRQARYLP